MKMTPVKLFNDLMHIHRLTRISDLLSLFLVMMCARMFEGYYGESIWWYICGFIISTIVTSLFAMRRSIKFKHKLNDFIQVENHELATMIVEKKIVKPSHIKPILEDISKAEE